MSREPTRKASRDGHSPPSSAPSSSSSVTAIAAEQPPQLLIPLIKNGLQSFKTEAAKYFLALGGALQSIAAQSRAVAEASRKAAGTQSADGSDHAVAQLESMLSDALEMQVLGQASHANLHQILRELASCHDPTARLMRLPLTLATLGILYRIEASRVEDAAVDVATLTADMRSMTLKVALHVAVADKQTSLLTQLIKAATRHFDRNEGLMRDQTAGLVREAGAVVRSFRARLDAAGQTAHSIDQQYGEIRQAIDKIIVSLQAEDIARQRIEHVQQALAQLATGQHGAALSPADADILVLQRSQLESTRNFLRDSLAGVHEGLVSLGPHLDSLTAETSSLASQTNQEGTSFSADISSRLETLCKLLSPYLASARQLVSTIESVIPAMTEMKTALKAVENIQASIRVLALNAKIKTKLLGPHGTVIGALAIELHQIARQSDIDTRAMVTSLTAIENPLSVLMQQKDTSSAARMMQYSCDELHRELQAVIRSVVAGSLQLSELLSSLLDQSAKLRADLAGTVEVAARAAEIVATLDGVLNHIDSSLQLAGYCHKTPVSGSARTKSLTALYSMQSERHVHEQLTQGEKSPPSTPPATDTSELGSNIELF